MKKARFDLSPVEPAHPMQVRMHEDLIGIYSHIRDHYQQEIDKTFDRVASQIGFVITTSMPVILKIDKGGLVAGGIIIDGLQFKGTLFEKEFNGLLKTTKETHFPDKVTPGEYRIFLFWYEALKIKLRTEWMEPAHIGSWMEPAHFGSIIMQHDWMKNIEEEEFTEAGLKRPLMPEVKEPVHWFNPKVSLSANELILINVIDQVYPELRLVEKITSIRESYKRVIRPEVKEPVHYKEGDYHVDFGRIRTLINELDSLLKQYGY
jgi:hypothetical protein